MTLYEVARPRIRPGDVFAFGGSGLISAGIKLFTRSAVSHVAAVRMNERGRILLIESTTLAGQKGVQENYVSERIADYDGSVYLLSLSQGTRARVNWPRYFDFLDSYTARQVQYDYRQCLRMALAPLAHVPGLGFLRNHEDLSKVYCSELIAAALEYAGGLPFGMDASDISPQDLCEFALYQDCVQVKGKARAIRNFNARPLPPAIIGATA